MTTADRDTDRNTRTAYTIGLVSNLLVDLDGDGVTPKKRLVYHCAGLAGFGGSSYIDGVILQDADEAGDSTLESRTYTLQNWRADVAVAAKVGVGAGIDGAFVCRGDVVYEAYGKATSEPLNSADFNGDDGVDDLDNTAFFAAFSNGAPEADLNLDDAIDDLDITAWNAIFQSGVTKEPGSGALSGLLVGYAGYMRDGYDDDLYHVRHRVYDTELGRWTRRDSLGYVDGMSVYEYVASIGITVTDPMGLAGSISNPKGAVSAAISMLQATGRYTTRALIEELCRMGLGAFAKYIAEELGVDVSLVEEICGAIGGKKPSKPRPNVSPGVKSPSPNVPVKPAPKRKPGRENDPFCDGCDALHDAYKLACAVPCPPGLECSAYDVIVRSAEICVDLRHRYIQINCQSICYQKTRDKDPEHPGQLEQMIIKLKKCRDNQVNACNSVNATQLIGPCK